MAIRFNTFGLSAFITKITHKFTFDDSMKTSTWGLRYTDTILRCGPVNGTSITAPAYRTARVQSRDE